MNVDLYTARERVRRLLLVVFLVLAEMKGEIIGLMKAVFSPISIQMGLLSNDFFSTTLIIAVFVLMYFLAERLLDLSIDRSRFARKLILGDDHVEGQWLEVVTDGSEPLGGAFIQIDFDVKRVAYAIRGQTFNLVGVPRGTFTSTMTLYESGTKRLFYTFEGKEMSIRPVAGDGDDVPQPKDTLANTIFTSGTGTLDFTLPTRSPNDYFDGFFNSTISGESALAGKNNGVHARFFVSGIRLEHFLEEVRDARKIAEDADNRTGSYYGMELDEIKNLARVVKTYCKKGIVKKTGLTNVGQQHLITHFLSFSMKRRNWTSRSSEIGDDSLT